jgi:hypothetical protein
VLQQPGMGSVTNFTWKPLVAASPSSGSLKSDQGAIGISIGRPANPKKDLSSYCPNCSTELSGHRCKAVCKKCGF